MKNAPFKPFLVADGGHIVCPDWLARQREYAEWIRFIVLQRDPTWRDYMEEKLTACGFEVRRG